MFGFLGSPCRSCSPADTHSTYRSFFCGLSGALRDDYSPAARFLVNRDSTFLSILGASVSPAHPETTLRTCCNPISVPKPLFSDGIHSRFAAAVTVCGLATKLEDDRDDETGLRRTAARLLGRSISPMTDKAVSFLNSIRFPTSEISDLMTGQSALEARRPDLVTAASPTAEAYGTIFGEAARIGGAGKEQSRFQSIGRSLGRLIYWRDAWDDRAADKERGRFNPLEKADPEELPQRFGEAMIVLDGGASLPGRFQGTIGEILASTSSRHRELIPDAMMRRTKEKRSKKKIEHEKDNWCSSCCHNFDCCITESCCVGISCCD